MRVFTSEELAIIRKMGGENGRNLYSLINEWLVGVSFEIDIEMKSVNFIFEENEALQLRQRIDKIQSIVIQSVNLIKLLEDKGYIFTYVNANQLPPNPFVFGQVTIDVSSQPYRFPDERISALFCSYSTKEIFITPELNKFIADGFITREEGRANRQWRTTRWALLVAITALALNIIFNIINIFGFKK